MASETNNPAIERLRQAQETLDAANERFGSICDKVERRLQVLSRIPAVAALQRDLDAFALATGAEREAMDEFVEALKGVWPKEGFGGC